MTTQTGQQSPGAVLVERLVERMLVTARELSKAYIAGKHLSVSERVEICAQLAKLEAETQHLSHQLRGGIALFVSLHQADDKKTAAELITALSKEEHAETFKWLEEEKKRILAERDMPQA